MRKQDACIEFKRVDVKRFQLLMSELLAQKIGKTRIFLDRQNARAFFKKEFC